MFALIFALSCASTAFAASNTCPHCSLVIEAEKDYNKHLSEECPNLYSGNTGAIIYYCDYTDNGCTAKFTEEGEYEKHLEICPFKKTSWGDEVANFFLDLDYEDFTNVLDKITEALVGVGLPGILVSIIDLLEQGVTALIGELA